MRIGGIDPKTLPNEEILVLPRGDQQLVIKARGIPGLDEFNALCPLPVPPVKFKPGGVSEADTDNASYKSMMVEYNKRLTAYIIVKALEPSQIEWETVNMDAPGTWANYETDLLNSGLSRFEVNLINNLALGANALDEAKMKQAREVFLRGQQQASGK